MLINKLFFSHIKGLCSMTRSKRFVKESSHTFRICPAVSKMGKEGRRDEAFTELIIHLKLLCVLGSENFISRVSGNRARQSPRELPNLWCQGLIEVALEPFLQFIFWNLQILMRKTQNRTPLPPLPTLTSINLNTFWSLSYPFVPLPLLAAPN